MKRIGGTQCCAIWPQLVTAGKTCARNLLTVKKCPFQELNICGLQQTMGEAGSPISFKRYRNIQENLNYYYRVWLKSHDSWFTMRFWIFTMEFFGFMFHESLFTTRKKDKNQWNYQWFVTLKQNESYLIILNTKLYVDSICFLLLLLSILFPIRPNNFKKSYSVISEKRD